MNQLSLRLIAIGVVGLCPAMIARAGLASRFLRRAVFEGERP